MRRCVVWFSMMTGIIMPVLPAGQPNGMAIPAGVVSSHIIKSEFQEDSTRIHIMATDLHHHQDLHLVFVLPVEPISDHYQFGSGMEEFQLLINEGFIASNVACYFLIIN